MIDQNFSCYFFYQKAGIKLFHLQNYKFSHFIEFETRKLLHSYQKIHFEILFTAADITAINLVFCLLFFIHKNFASHSNN